jgi:hypothetical protein
LYKAGAYCHDCPEDVSARSADEALLDLGRRQAAALQADVKSMQDRLSRQDQKNQHQV